MSRTRGGWPLCVDYQIGGNHFAPPGVPGKENVATDIALSQFNMVLTGVIPVHRHARLPIRSRPAPAIRPFMA